MRRAATWITNVKQGGQPSAVAPDPKMERLAIAAAEAVGAEIAGVDVLVTADGAPTVLEVNSMPAWSGLQKVSKRNIAEAIASALMHELSAGLRNGALHERPRRSGSGGLYRGVPGRARRAQTRQRASVCARPPHGGRGLCSQRRGERALRSRQGGRGSEPASAPPSTRRLGGRSEHQSRHHTPVRAACGCRGGLGCAFAPGLGARARRSRFVRRRRRLLRHSRGQSRRPRTRAST